MKFGKWIGRTMSDKESGRLIVTKDDIIEVHAEEAGFHNDVKYVCRGPRERGFFMAEKWDFKFGFTLI